LWSGLREGVRCVTQPPSLRFLAQLTQREAIRSGFPRPGPQRMIDTRPASPTLNCIEVQLTPDQRAFVRQAIESGRLHREEDAVQEALALWEERERTRAEILAAVDVAEGSIARGEGCPITQDSMRQLAGEVKQRGRRRDIETLLRQ